MVDEKVKEKRREGRVEWQICPGHGKGMGGVVTFFKQEMGRGYNFYLKMFQGIQF